MKCSQSQDTKLEMLSDTVHKVGNAHRDRTLSWKCSERQDTKLEMLPETGH